MTYTPKGPFVNGSAVPPINAALLNGIETALSQGFVFNAPPPSGGDDTGILQPLIDAAMTSTGVGSGPGVVILGPGIYKGNFTLSGGFWKAKIKGRGKQATYVQAYDSTKPVFHVQGGTGSLTSGSIEDLTVAGTDISSSTARSGVCGIEIEGVGGFQVERVQYLNLQVGHRWKNDGNGEFTEFCVCRDINMNFVTLPFEYAGAGSYHGSGIDGNSVLTMEASDTNVMKIGAGCTVYNAPLSITLFTSSGSIAGNFITNYSTGPAFFYGHLRAEIFGGAWTWGWPGGSVVYYSGTMNTWSSGTHLGLLFRVDKVATSGTNILPTLAPWNVQQTLVSGTTAIMGAAPINGPAMYDATIEITGPSSYWVSTTLRIWFSGSAPATKITVVETHYTNTPGTAGTPVFTWNTTTNQLQVAGSSSGYDSTYTANASYRVAQHANSGDNLGQY